MNWPVAGAILFGLLVCGLAANVAAVGVDADVDKYDDEYFDERFLESSYHGLIKENETIVEITPLIKVDGMKISGFTIIKKGNHEVPFQIELANNLGILKATRTLNCEKHRNYKFEIAAVFNDGSHSKSANVHITVIDINEYSPTFLQPSYLTEVDEGRLYQEIIRVEATDRDCTPLYGDVCKYEILTSDQPFTIDNEGSIRNTEPLSHIVSHNHILSVVAYDCAMKQSAPVMVNIRVRRVCEARLMGIPERIDYTANSMESVSLFPKIHLELCDMQCADDNLVIETSVTLKTKHISFGCDRDTTQCIRNGLINLLPKGMEWTSGLISDEGPETVFHFNGSTGVNVPSTLINHHDFALHPFSIVTMFRHHNILLNDKHTKEHIVCSADDHKMNRHHMALFVRNCRLILLLRKNFNEGDLNIFSPAEWRWKIPEVCDNEWHHYVINVDVPKIELYIDGIKFEANAEDRHSNPEVIDDWPLHAAHGVNTTLIVGACLQGAENRMKHGFNGDISEVRVAIRRTLQPNEIKCGTDCAEHLIPPAEHYLEPAQQVQENAQLNEIAIEGSNKSNVEVLLQKIQYINKKKIPTIGRRNIEVRTTISCPNHKAIRLPTMETYIMVTPAASPLSISNNEQHIMSNHVYDKQITDEQKPKILITGDRNHLVTYPDIKQGVHILANISIKIFSDGFLKENLQKLESCSVSVFPSLNPDHEQITINGWMDQLHDNNDEPIIIDPSNSANNNNNNNNNDDDDGDDGKMMNAHTNYANLMQVDIKPKINQNGVEMLGYDTIENYQKLLKSLVYTNKKPAYYLNRVFKLSCAQVNSQFRSADFILTITVLHPKQMPNVAAISLQQHEPNNIMVHLHDIQEPTVKVHNIVKKAQSFHSTMLIIVICVSFVVLIVGFGIARLRNQTTRNLERHQPCPKVAPEQQLDWDDSALTITINPMQNGGVSDDSSDSENSDSDDDDATNGRYRNVSQLEWDNSTM